MATIQRRADDGFERYFAEKLWAWLPEIQRHEDGLAERPGVLRAIVDVIARQLAVARRSADRLVEDPFIEVCDDWAIAYLADLVGTRLVHELNRRARRVDVARTIFYRRRKGTPRVLEMLVRDITGWEGALAEAFRRLGRTRHRLDPEPAALAGRVTGTPPGGWARLDSPRIADLLDGPFDELAHTADVRQLRGHLGRWNIPKLNFHLYRLASYRVASAGSVSGDLGATPFDLGAGRFTFDPSGRDVPLFAPVRRSNEDCEPVLEWEVPAPIRCRLLGEAAFRWTRAQLDVITPPLDPDVIDDLARWAGDRFPHEARLRETVATIPHAIALTEAGIDALLAATVTDDSARPHLVPEAVSVEAIPQHHVVAGNLAAWSLPIAPPTKEVMIDPERGRFAFFGPPPSTPPVTIHHVGFPGEIGAGTYDRAASLAAGALTLPPGPAPLVIPADGVHQLVRSETRAIAGDVTGVRQLVVQAADRRRPYLVRGAAAPVAWTLTALPKPPVPPGTEEPPSSRRSLVLDGLWIGAAVTGASPLPPPLVPIAADLVLDGVWDEVVLRHVTLDPGGERARLVPTLATAIPYLRLIVRGTVERLVIERSIVGPIAEDAGGELHELVIRDSIVRAPDNAPVAAVVPAIATALGEVTLERVTVFGDLAANRLEATEALVTGHVVVTDNQHGCFRFSAARSDGSIFPPRFSSVMFRGGVPDHVFTSRRFGDPGFAQLSPSAPPSLVRGAENTGEIGAWNHLLDPIELDDLRAKVDEYMPFGLIAQFITET